MVMILIFLLAGAVSVGASALLTRTTETRSGASSDFATQSAVAEMAYAASHSCSPSPDFALQLTCAGQAGAPNAALTPLSMGTPKPVGASDSCSVTVLTASQPTWLLLSVRPRGTLTFAYIRTFSTGTPAPTCLEDLKSIKGVLPGCMAAAAQGQQALALACAIPQLPASRLYLVVRNGQPAQGFTVSANTSTAGAGGGGAFYMTIAGTGFPFPMDLEQAIMYIPNQGRPQVRYEAPLP